MPMRVTEKAFRRFTAIYLICAALYVVLGFASIVNAYAQSTNPMIPVPDRFTNAPSGSDDVAVEAYYDYLNIRHFNQQNETYFLDPVDFITIYGILAGILIIFYFLMMAWYARRSKGDLYPVEVYNGYLSERGGPVDSFNWAVYAILAAFMIYYVVVHLIYGQYY